MKQTTHQNSFSSKLVLVAIFLLLFTAFTSVNAQSRTITKVPINTNSNGQAKNPDGYVEYLPQNYNSRNDWPVLIWHHGLGKGGSGSSSDLQKLMDHAIMNWLKTHNVPFVVLAPQDGNGYFGAGRMELFYKWAKGEYQNKTNTNSYHISVLSASGAGLSNFLQDNSQFAKEVATITVNGALTGTGNNTIYTNVVNNKTKIWFHHGEADNTVTCGAPLNFYRGLVNKAGGFDFSKFRYTMYAGMGHSAWEEVYDNSGTNKSKVTGAISGGNYGNFYNWTSGSWYDWMLQNAKGINSNNPTPPVVDAGNDINVTLPTANVALSGQVEPGASTVESYLWEKVSGPSSYQLANANTKNATTSRLVEGVYVFKFTATTEEGLSDSDEVELLVNSDPDVIAPTSLSLSNRNISENNIAGATVGQLSANGTAPRTFKLVSGSGSADNSYFSVSGTKLIIDGSADYETKSSYSVRLRASNDAGQIEKSFTIVINDEEEGTTTGRLAKLNFGRNNSEPVAGWNNLFLNYPIEGASPFNLFDEDEEATSWKLRVTSQFLSTPNEIGPTTGNNSGKYPDGVLEYAWMDRYGAEIEIYGLDNSKLYTFNMIGNSQSSLALMQCYVNGQQVGETKNVQNNANKGQYEFIAVNVSPQNGSIKIRINGDNSDGRNYGFLAAMTISENSGSNMRSTAAAPSVTMVEEENILAENLVVYPNPSSSGVFKIEGISISAGYDYQITNMQGELVQQSKVTEQLVLDEIPGIYTLHIPALNKQIRIIKK